MNTVGLLLVLGLAFFAMKQKVEKTRNMLLVVSALLGFCMFSAEGFKVAGDTGSAVDATCTGADADGVATPNCADAFVAAFAATGTTAASCPAGCTYTAADFQARSLVAADLPLLFPSCLPGQQVKASGGVLGSMCEPATTASVTWQTICGDGAECDGSITAFGGSTLAEDKTNQCGATLGGTWASTCICTDDSQTWTSGDDNGCSGSEPSTIT